MQVQPALKFMQENHIINISINIIPTQAIRAYELQMSFNPSILQVISVEQGDFFQDYNTYYSSGTIDNVNGRVTKLYGLVLGQGSITEAGTILIIHCNTTGLGLTSIIINKTGITNDTKYVPLTVMNGAIQVYGEFYPWDCNEDGTCNYLDASIVAHHYGGHGSQPADILEDGMVNYLDVSILVGYYKT
jgi:hypothetical protein